MQQKDAFLKFLKEKEFSGTKEDHHRYISKYYANEFGPRRDEILKIVELGVRGGSDVKIFSAWFSKSEIVGIDINEIIKPDNKYKKFVEYWNCRRMDKAQYRLYFFKYTE